VATACLRPIEDWRAKQVEGVEHVSGECTRARTVDVTYNAMKLGIKQHRVHSLPGAGFDANDTVAASRQARAALPEGCR
jgi:hypothetical protein